MRICILMGHNYDCRLATQMSFRFPQFTATPLAQLVPSASHDAVVLMQVLYTSHASYFFVYRCLSYLIAHNAYAIFSNNVLYY